MSNLVNCNSRLGTTKKVKRNGVKTFLFVQKLTVLVFCMMLTVPTGSKVSVVNEYQVKADQSVEGRLIQALEELLEDAEPTPTPVIVDVPVQEDDSDIQRVLVMSQEKLTRQLKTFSKYIKKSYKEAQKEQKRIEQEQAAAKAAEEEKYINTILDKASNVPNGESGCKSQFKSWMRASSISAKRSGQWKLLHHENCYEDPDTHFMMYKCEDGEVRICCALGSYYTDLIGTKVNIIFEDGHMLKCILADQKADQHTDRTNRYHLCDGSVLEFVVGSGFKGDDTYPEWTKGKIHYIDIVGAVNDGEGFKWDW